MRHIPIACSLCLVLLGSSAWGAPRRAPRSGGAKAKVAKAPAPATEVAFSEQSATDVRGFGVATTWRLRSNGTVVREGNHAGEHMGDPGQSFREHGTFNAADFKPLVAYLESSRLLNLKVPPTSEMEGWRSISLVRGGRRREIVLPDSAPAPAPFWVAATLVRGITAGVEWKNGSQKAPAAP